MFKKTITYTNYDGVEVKEDFYFNLSKRELTEWQFSVEGGIVAKMQKAIDSKNAPQIMDLFKELIAKSYGVKSDDGKRFIKSKEISDEFMQTPAYDELFMNLFTVEDEAVKFIKAIVPSDLAAEVQDKKLLGQELK